jgi:uncharacterized protein YlxP (DUF503 family)
LEGWSRTPTGHVCRPRTERGSRFQPQLDHSMVVAVLSVDVHLPYSQSLKDKRMVLRRIKDRLQKLNVAVAEVEHQDRWQRAGLGIVAISTTMEHVEEQLRAAADEIDRVEPGIVVRTEIEFLT